MNITDAENAYLAGRAQFQAWQEQFEAQWFAPIGLTLLGMLLGRMTPAERQALRQANPQAYDEVEKMIGGTNATAKPTAR